MVTVNFNAGPLLADCVRSVLASTVPVEVVVVDNGSLDGSLDELRRAVAADPRVRIMEMGRNVGFARANNLALPHTQAPYVLLLNPDCTVAPDTLARMKEALDARPEFGMAGCLLVNPDGTEQAGCRRRSPDPVRAFRRAFGLGGRGADGERSDFLMVGEPLPSGPVAVDAISGAFMFVRRSALQQVGPLDEGYFLHCEDLDWCERFRRAGQGVLFVPDVAVVHAKGSCSRSRPVRVLWHMHRGMLRYYRKFLRDRHPLPLLWLVAAGITLRFSALSTLALLRMARARLR